jgi:LmbE family N-acetylglucosaminyl deacetylase
MAVVYLSPHLDDAVLSHGGLIWEQTQQGLEVVIFTVCAGDPPDGKFSNFAESIHNRWGVNRDVIAQRRIEDIESCLRLEASYHHMEVPDCIYRRSPITGKHLYDSEEALWVPVHPDENFLVEVIANALKERLSPKDSLICPLTLGNHVDHRLTRAAAEKLGVQLRYYPDYPYALYEDIFPVIASWPASLHAITPEGMLAWQDAVAAHRSQISTFWQNLAEMRASLEKYYDQMGGVLLWE